MDLTFEIVEKRIDGVSVLTVTGEIDLATAPDLKERLMAQEADQVSAIVVDLTEVSFIDSSALGVLVAAYRRQEDAGGTLRLVVTEPRILKVLEITDLTSVFPVFASVDEAVARMSDTVELTIPVRSDLLILARLTAAAMAARAEFGIEDIEDLRLVVEELCISVIGAHDRAEPSSFASPRTMAPSRWDVQCRGRAMLTAGARRSPTSCRSGSSRRWWTSTERTQ